MNWAMASRVTSSSVGPRPARRDDDVRAVPCLLKDAGESILVVADGCDAVVADADCGELGGEVVALVSVSAPSRISVPMEMILRAAPQHRLWSLPRCPPATSHRRFLYSNHMSDLPTGTKR